MALIAALKRLIYAPKATRQLKFTPHQVTRMAEYQKWTRADLIKRIFELEGKDPSTAQNSMPDPPVKSSKAKRHESYDISRHPVRKIALRFSYLGWNYGGLAIQHEDTPLPTIEGTILSAMQRCRLIPEAASLFDIDFSRCGRTDRGVSAFSQVIALNVRSKLSPEEQKDPANDNKELNYIHILNQLLPPDIRVYSVALRLPEGFDARFSCEYRHYRYFFHKGDLDIDLMREAAKLYLGEHDFRSFCKVDGSKQLQHHDRVMLEADITQLSGDIYYFNLKGRAFLWHQVRCMMAILFLVGQKLEKPSIVTDLLNPQKYPGRPVYDMAHDVPLVLYDCTFKEPIEWITPNAMPQERMENSNFKHWHEYMLQSTLSLAMMQHLAERTGSERTFPRADDGGDKVAVINGAGSFSRKIPYIPIDQRKMLDTPDVVNEKWRKRKEATQ